MRTRIADYQLVRPLGNELRKGQSSSPAGGADDTGPYLAHPPARLGVGSQVVVHTNPRRTPGAAAWVRQLAAAHSPNLPGLLELGPDPEGDPGSLYWAHTYTGDASLAQPPFSLSMAFALWLVSGAARGAHAMHEIGLVHGDINPRLIRFNGQVVTLDPPDGPGNDPPGLVRRLERPGDLDNLEPGVARGDLPSRASEIWTLGAILHYALTGQLLHPGLAGDPPVTAVQRIMFEPPTVAAGLDPEAARIITSCLSSDPRQRPQTAGVLADQLETLGRQR